MFSLSGTNWQLCVELSQNELYPVVAMYLLDEPKVIYLRVYGLFIFVLVPGLTEKL